MSEDNTMIKDQSESEKLKPEETVHDDPDSPNPTEAESVESPESGVLPGEMDMYGRRTPKPYHERAYLLYGKEKPNTMFDYAGTKSFLQNIGFDGGELRQARSGKYYAQAMRNTESAEENGLTCLFCGRPVLGVDYYRLPEGKVRCTNCSRTLIKTPDELNDLYRRVLSDFESFFGVTIDLPLTIEMNRQRKLKKKWKLLTKEEPENGIYVPCSTFVYKDKEGIICLDNSAPRLSVLVALAHSLTFVWQYTNWNEKKRLSKAMMRKREVISHGMSAWVEVQYLYLLGETAAARRQEIRYRAREDASGYGFSLYEKEYPINRETVLVEDSPFKAEGYPIQ